MKKKYILLISYIMFIIIGYVFILKSDTWDLGSADSMTTVGIITLISGIVGFFIEIYYKK